MNGPNQEALTCRADFVIIILPKKQVAGVLNWVFFVIFESEQKQIEEIKPTSILPRTPFWDALKINRGLRQGDLN